MSEASGSFYRAAENFRRAAIHKNICVAMWSTFDMDPVATVNHMREIQVGFVCPHVLIQYNPWFMIYVY